MTSNQRTRGRPPKTPADRLIQRSIRMTARQWSIVDAMGIEALRKKVDGFAKLIKSAG